MKKFLALMVAFLCALSIMFTACMDVNPDADNEGNKNEQTDGNGNSDGKEEGGNQGNGNGNNDTHECDYESEWTAGESTHWHESLCSKHPNNKSDEAPHEFTSLTGTCTVCDAPAPERFYEGDKLPYFSFKTYANSTETYSTEFAAGKVLVINFWFRTCAPCVEEMPVFENISQEYGDDIEVVALHATNSMEGSAESFINSQGWSDYKITFGLDENNVVFDKLSVSSSYPVTVVVSPEGIIVEIIYGKVIRIEDLTTFKEVDYIHPAINKALGKK